MYNMDLFGFKARKLAKQEEQMRLEVEREAERLEIAKAEIAEVFKKDSAPPERDSDTGFFGDVAGKCPLCGKDVIRNRFGYGCRGYKEGCTFKIGGTICGRDISIANVKKLLETGKTYKIEGFTSPKSGKKFDSYLKIEKGKVIFDFGN